MNKQEIEQKVSANDYESKLPYPVFRSDPNNSSKKKAYREDDHRLYLKFKADFRGYIEQRLGRSVTDPQFSVVFDKAWDDGHSDGYSAVLDRASEILDIIETFEEETDAG